MNWFTGFAVYFIIWWLSLFVVLPFGVRTQEEEGSVTPGTDPGAPVRARFAFKLLANTILAGVLFGAWYWLVYVSGWSFDSLPSIFPQDR